MHHFQQANMDISGSLFSFLLYFLNCLFFILKIYYYKMENYSNKIANLFRNKFQLKKGDCVALFIENSPEHVGIWLGLSKIGVISALINTNLKGEQLMHSIKVAKAKYVIYGSSLTAYINTIVEDLSKDIGLIVNLENEHDSVENCFELNLNLKAVSDQYPILNEKINLEGLKIFKFRKKSKMN
jgi:solute carrier family 27 fatty acid transporter 1/4